MSDNGMKAPIEQLNLQDLQQEWQRTVSSLQAMEQGNPTWEWKPVQLQLERLHALAMELRRKKALDRAKWQP